MLSIAQPADERDDIEAEFPVRERPAAFFLRAIGLMKAGARRGDAAADAEGQAMDALFASTYGLIAQSEQ